MCCGLPKLNHKSSPQKLSVKEKKRKEKHSNQRNGIQSKTIFQNTKPAVW
jgi:hypothetical protein